MKEIITYDVFIDEEDELGVDKLSLVKKPAIMEDFIYQNEVEEIYKEVKLEEEKRIITGPALIPDIQIIRKDEDGEPFYIKYSTQQIESIVQRFFKDKDQYSVNKDHKSEVKGVWMYESWIVGENDKSKDLGFNLPKGTWMVSMKVEDEEIWQGIKSGKYKGFSIEGLFKFKRQSNWLNQFRWTRTNVNSSNVDRILYNDESRELIIKFNTGDTYTYSDINFVEFNSVVSGLAECKTEGENKWGEWSVGKTPSIGAAVWKYLIDTGKQYKKGGSFQSEEISEEEIIEKLNNIELSSDILEQLGNRYTQSELRRLIELLRQLRILIKLKEEKDPEYKRDKKNKNINMVSAILKDGSTIYTDSESMQVGVEVYFLNGEDKVKPEAGEYELEDGSIVVVDEKSTIAEIKSTEEDVENPEEVVDQEEPEVVENPNNDIEAIKGMLENISMKLDVLIAEKLSKIEQSIITLEEKVETNIVKSEMKSVETVDDKRNIAQSIDKKSKLDYDLIRKLNRKF